MRIKVCLCVWLCTLLVLGGGGAACAIELSGAPLEGELPMELACKSALLMEPESGQIIFEYNADERRPVASVTKIMSILLACEALEEGRAGLDDVVNISKNAAGMGGSQVLLDVGEQQPFSILLKSMIVGSANDAAVAIGEHLYGSEEQFVRRMNERAQQLSMNNTHFSNCTGLPAEDHYTTARDVAIMSTALLNYPEYFEYSTIWLDEVDHGNGRVTQLTNTNRLIRLYEGCDGLKTGSTNEAGYCMSATAQRGDMRLVAVVLGAQSGKERFEIAEKMLDYGFANYRIYPVAERGAKVRGKLRVVGGDAEDVELVLDGDLTLLIEKGDEGDIQLLPSLPESVRAPLEAGQHVGYVEVHRNGRMVGQVPVASACAVGAQGFGSSLNRILENWWL